MRSAATIIAATIAATGLTVLDDILHGRVNVKPVVGGFIVGTFLLMIAFYSVDIAVALALMFLVSSVLLNAVPILSKVQK